MVDKQKIPLTKQEHDFLPDEGDHIIYSLFYFSTLTVTPDLNRNSGKDAQALTLSGIFYGTPCNTKTFVV